MTNVGSGPSSTEQSSASDQGWSSQRTSRPSSAAATRLSTTTEDAYAAGLVDGEGCITLEPASNRRSYRVRVDIGMTKKSSSVLHGMKTLYGGQVRHVRKATKKWEAAECWTLHGPEATAFLKQILPYLRLKYGQALLAVQADELRLDKNGPNGERRRWPAEATEKARQIHLAIQKLNRKGLGDSTPDTDLLPFALLVDGKWKSPQLDLFSNLPSTSYISPWPKAGLMRSGRAYEHQMLELRTDENGSSLLRTPQANLTEAKPGIKTSGRTPADPQVGLADQVMELLGTPNSHPRTHSPREVDHGIQLANQVASLLPTPAAADGTGGKQHKKGSITRTGMKEDGTKVQVSLRDALNLLPTPTAGNFNDGESLETWEARRQRNIEKGYNGNGQGTPLTIAVQRLLPTPAARDWKGGTTPESEEATRRSRGDGGASDLPSVVKLLPTPRTQLAERRNSTPWERPLDQPQNLENVIARLPTPRATRGGSATETVALLHTPQARDWKGEPGPAHDNGGLNRDIRLLPTPRSTDANGTGAHGEGGMDLRTEIQEIGDHMELPYEGGKKSEEYEHPTLWTQADVSPSRS